MKLTIIYKSEKTQITYADNYKFDSGFLVLSNPREKEEEEPEIDGMYLPCSEITMFSVNK